jgi:hypothetical protein
MPDNTINPEENTETPGNTDNPSGQSEENIRDNDLIEGSTASLKEEIPPPVVPSKPVQPKSVDSDNRLSLIDRNNLQILMSTKKGVKISTVVRDKNSSDEIQSDEIYLPPRNDFGTQEAEITISISENKSEPEESASEHLQEVLGDEGRFTPKLIDEHLQKVRFDLFHGESVRIDYDFRDKKTSANAKRYKNFVSPKEEANVYEVEVTIAVDLADTTPLETPLRDDHGRIALIPNPEVAELIQAPLPLGDYSEGGYVEDGSYKNPFDNVRSLIRKNLTIGISIAVALHLAAAGLAFYKISKQPKDANQEETQRLIVIQDLPDPKIKLENVEDPNKPPPVEEQTEVSIPRRDIPPRKVIQPPKVSRPKENESSKDTTETSRLTKELDSLRRLGDSLLASDTAKGIDTSKAFFDIPDSLRNNFNEGEIGLGMYFPNNWKLIDEREVNRKEKEFRGVILTDTTAEKPGTMTIFIRLDTENRGFNTEEFTTEFQMLDTNLSGFAKPPETQAAHTKYEFYVMNTLGTEKLSVKAEVRKEFFDKYKNEIEAVVRSINIKKKVEPEGTNKDNSETEDENSDEVTDEQ